MVTFTVHTDPPSGENHEAEQAEEGTGAQKEARIRTREANPSCATQRSTDLSCWDVMRVMSACYLDVPYQE